MKTQTFTATLILILSSALSVLLTSCVQGPTKETLDAVAALKKIQAGTQVGVSYEQYGQLLVEAKAKTNEAVRSLPEGSLKTELTGAMDAYADAATVWNLKITNNSLSDRGFHGLIAKYHIPVSTSKIALRPQPDGSLKSVDVGGGPAIANPDEALKIIWLRADTHLEQISKLVGQEPKS